MTSRVRFCVHCGPSLEEADAFCPACGKPAAGVSAAPATVAHAPVARAPVAQAPIPPAYMPPPETYIPPQAPPPAAGSGRPGLLTLGAFGCAGLAGIVAVGALIVAGLAIYGGRSAAPGGTPTVPFSRTETPAAVSSTVTAAVPTAAPSPSLPPATPTAVAPTAAPTAASTTTSTATPTRLPATPVPPTATRTPLPATPTPKSVPTATPIPTIEPRSVGASLFTDGMSGSYAGWPEGSAADYNRYFENGQYHMVVSTPNWTVRSVPGIGLNLGSFLYSAGVKYLEGPTNGDFGIVFRQKDQNFYYFAISAGGYWSLMKLQAGSFSTLVTWTPTSNIFKGVATNELEVLAVGSSFSFFINGGKVGAYTDGSFAAGNIGVATGTSDQGGTHVAFDNIQVNAIGAGSSSAPSTPTPVAGAHTVFFTMRDGNPWAYVTDKQGKRWDLPGYLSIGTIHTEPGDRIVLQTDAAGFAFLFDCGLSPDAFSPCDFTADSPANLPKEIRVLRGSVPGFINISRPGNWGNARPGFPGQRYPADPVLRISFGQ